MVSSLQRFFYLLLPKKGPHTNSKGVVVFLVTSRFTWSCLSYGYLVHPNTAFPPASKRSSYFWTEWFTALERQLCSSDWTTVPVVLRPISDSRLLPYIPPTSRPPFRESHRSVLWAEAVSYVYPEPRSLQVEGVCVWKWRGDRVILCVSAKTKSGGIATIEPPDRAHPNENRGNEISWDHRERLFS